MFVIFTLRYPHSYHSLTDAFRPRARLVTCLSVTAAG